MSNAGEVMTNKSEFERLLAICQEIADYIPDGVVFIGGIAVYMHAINHQLNHIAEFTHDADFYISFADMGDLRDIEELTPNRRLSKHQFIKSGFEFDVYTERQSSLIVPYDDVIANSVSYENMRVASLEHLLALKLEAYRNRRGSAKGQKDAKDIIRLAILGAEIGFNPDIAMPYIDDEHKDLLLDIHRGSEVVAIAQGNSVVAKKIRSKVAELTKSLSVKTRQHSRFG